jgi:hypothetical protein
VRGRQGGGMKYDVTKTAQELSQIMKRLKISELSHFLGDVF